MATREPTLAAPVAIWGAYPFHKATWLNLRHVRCWDSTPAFLDMGQGAGREYQLIFIGRDRRPQATIQGLTEGEARWMADTLMREQAAWFSG